jgi:hypothetical protein
MHPDRPSLPTIRYWMEHAIERPLHGSPPQAEEARDALTECRRLMEVGLGLLAAAEVALDCLERRGGHSIPVEEVRSQLRAAIEAAKER